jgi:hypothetical protein
MNHDKCSSIPNTAKTGRKKHTNPVMKCARHQVTKSLSLALEDSSINGEAMEGTTMHYWLKASKRAGCSPSLNYLGFATRLDKITSSRAEIEWYKALFDANRGYYDMFKQRRSPKMFDRANMCRPKLVQFSDGMLSMLDNSQLPHDFHRRAKYLVNAARFYQLPVQPLDIADYHHNKLHRTRGSYISHGHEIRQGQHHHHS